MQKADCQVPLRAKKPRMSEYGKKKHMEKKCKKTKRNYMGYAIGRIIASFLGALLAGFFFILIAVHSVDYNASLSAAPLSPIAIFFCYAAMIYAVSIVFGQYGAAQLAPHVWLTQWLSSSDRFKLITIVSYIVALIGEFVGMLLASYYSSYLIGATAALGCAEPVASVSFVQTWLTDLFVKLLVGHIVIISVKRHKGGPFGTLAVALTVAAAIVSLGAVTGGAYSLTRYTSVAIAQNCFSGSTFFAQLINFFLAGFANWFFTAVVFTSANSQQMHSAMKSHMYM